MDTQAILQRESGIVRDCLREGRVPKLAGLPTPWVKEVFIFSILFKTQRSFMLDKCISSKNKNTSYDIVWISSHIKN